MDGKEQINIVRSDVKRLAKLATVAKSAGGEVLLDVLGETVLECVNLLTAQYNTMEAVKLRATCARLEMALNMQRMLTRAESQGQYARDELDRLLKDDEEE